MAAGADCFASAALCWLGEDCSAICPPEALRAAKRKTGIDIPERQNPNPTNHGKRARQKTSLLHLSTVAAQNNCNQPWVKFQSAGWVNIQSARTIKAHLIPAQLTKSQITTVYASEADRLNMALFGMTAAQWRAVNPEQTGNMRDAASIEQLVLSNLESINAMLIHQGVDVQERLSQLNAMAIVQMKSLLAHAGIKQLTTESKKLK